VTFYDGLKDCKEGYTDNINTNENPRGLNPVLIEEPTTTTWADKQQGIPTTEYVNLFAGAKKAEDAIFVIPTNERMSITVVYDIMTRDTLLSQNLSDGFTKGSRVQNKISQTLKELKLEAGKSYTIKLVVGIESVKVTVDVEDWIDYEGGEQKVDLPFNPEGEEEEEDEPAYEGTPLAAGNTYGYTDATTTEAGTTGTLYAKEGETDLFYDAKTDADPAEEIALFTEVPSGAYVATDLNEAMAWASEHAGEVYYIDNGDGTYTRYTASTSALDSPLKNYFTYEYVIPAGTKTGDENVTLQYVKITKQYQKNPETSEYELVEVARETVADKAITVNFDK
jgi:hypothetical protein